MQRNVHLGFMNDVRAFHKVQRKNLFEENEKLYQFGRDHIVIQIILGQNRLLTDRT